MHMLICWTQGNYLAKHKKDTNTYASKNVAYCQNYECTYLKLAHMLGNQKKKNNKRSWVLQSPLRHQFCFEVSYSKDSSILGFLILPSTSISSLHLRTLKHTHKNTTTSKNNARTHSLSFLIFLVLFLHFCYYSKPRNSLP